MRTRPFLYPQSIFSGSPGRVYCAAEIRFRMSAHTPARSNSSRILPAIADRPLALRRTAGAFSGSTYIRISCSSSAGRLSASVPRISVSCTLFESVSSNSSSIGFAFTRGFTPPRRRSAISDSSDSSSSTSAFGSRQRTRLQSRVNCTVAPSARPASRSITPMFANSPFTTSGTYRMRENSHCTRSAKRHSSPRLHHQIASRGRNCKAPWNDHAPRRAPIWEWFAIRSAKRLNQLPHPASPSEELLHQPLDRTQVAAVPLRWNLLRNCPKPVRLKPLDARQPRLKAAPTRHARVHLVARKHAPQRRIREAPLACIEAVPLVDEDRAVLALARSPLKDCLPSVAVSRPLIERQDTPELRQIPHFLHLGLGQIVHHLSWHQASDELAPKLQPTREKLTHAFANLQHHAWAISNQPVAHFNDIALWNRQPNRLSQPRNNQLIRQHASMLRVVLKLHHPQMPIRTQHQLALRATAHPANRLYRYDCQGPNSFPGSPANCVRWGDYQQSSAPKDYAALAPRRSSISARTA